MPNTLLTAIDQRLGHTPDLGESRRLFHGRGRCSPGLEDINVDWFDPIVLITLYALRPPDWTAALAGGLQRRLGARATCILVQHRCEHGGPIELVGGSMPADPRAREEGLTYRLHFGHPQNIGFFVDMRHGRALARSLARDRAVLNLFAYTCSFSVAALAGGATRVVNLDMNSRALDVGRENHRDNGLDLRATSFLAHNLFKSFSKLRRIGPFDLIVMDPPTAQGRSFGVHRDWPRLIQRLPSMAAPGADVVACLNTPRLPSSFLIDAFAEHLPSATLVAQHWPGPDLPEADPEAGLKVLHFRL